MYVLVYEPTRIQETIVEINKNSIIVTLMRLTRGSTNGFSVKGVLDTYLYICRRM